MEGTLDFDSFNLGANFVHFLVQMRTRKFAFEIY